MASVMIYYGGIKHGWQDIRFLGVLQRIAICYLFAALVFLNFNLRGLIATFVALLAGYWALMTFVPVPGIGAGHFGPDQNLANWIDANYLPGRLWDKTRDPEGLLSTLPAIGTCLLGVFAGMLLRDIRLKPQQKSLWLIGAGTVLVLAGHLWALQFPIIKAIWTSSFVLVAGGYSAILLGVCASDHRRVGTEELGDDLRLDRRQRDPALLHQRPVRLRTVRHAYHRRRRGGLSSTTW